MKKLTAISLALMFCVSVFASCASSDSASTDSTSTQDQASDSTASAEPTEELLDDGMTYKEGYPITKETVTLEAAIIYGAHKGNFEDYEYWDAIAQETNIDIELRILNSEENTNLMYATRNFPDFSFSTAVSSTQFTDAVLAGDIVNIDQYLEYAPTYNTYFEENPDMKALLFEADKKIYSLPYINIAEWDYGMRDCWFVNSDWLAELDIEMPTTLDDFTEYLRAVKANAGTGTIPENVIPYYFQHNSRIGGPFEIYASFGLSNGTANGFGDFIVDDVVMNNAMNPEIIEPIKYLNMLYSEGLIGPETFTDDWGSYTAKLKAEPAVVGSIASYSHNDMDHWEYMTPLNTGTGAQPMIRQQQQSLIKTNFVIFSENPYPVATVRLGDMLGETEWSVYSTWGEEGLGYTVTDDGEYRRVLAESELEGDAKKVPGNYGLGIITDELNKQLSADAIEDGRSREYAYYNIYKEFSPPANMSVYPKIPGIYTDQQQKDKMAQITTDTNNYINTMTARWITGEGDVDAEWDEYVAELIDLGMQERIDMSQAIYDAFMADQQ